MNNLQSVSDNPSDSSSLSSPIWNRESSAGTLPASSPGISVVKGKSQPIKVLTAPPFRSFTEPLRERLFTSPQIQRSVSQMPVSKSKFIYNLKNLNKYKAHLANANDEQLKIIVKRFFPNFISNLIENESEKHRLLKLCKNFDCDKKALTARKIISRVITQHNMEEEFGSKALDDNFINEIKALRKRLKKH